MALRYHRYWLVVGWLLIALVIWLSVTAQLRLHLPVKWADKVGHLTAYFVLMGWFIQLFRTHRQRLLWARLFIGQGLALEVVQGMSRWRTFDYWDAAANALGVSVAWWWAFRGLDRLLPALERGGCGNACPRPRTAPAAPVAGGVQKELYETRQNSCRGPSLRGFIIAYVEKLTSENRPRNPKTEFISGKAGTAWGTGGGRSLLRAAHAETYRPNRWEL